MDEATRSPGRAERVVEARIQELAATGALRGLPGEGAPLPDDEGGPAETWAARHLLRNANAAPEWTALRVEIDERTARLRHASRRTACGCTTARGTSP